MYREQHFDWDSGSARGLCFVRKGAKESVRNEFDNLCDDAMQSFVSPITGTAAKFIDEATEKLRELEGRGLATPRDRAYLTHIGKYERIFSKFRDDIAKENDEYRLEVMSIGDKGRGGGGEW